MKKRFTEEQIIKMLEEDRSGLTGGHPVVNTRSLLLDGRRIRSMTILDDYSRECLNIVVDTSLTGQGVCEELAILMSFRGKPEKIITDNGTEFTSNKVLDCAKGNN